MAIGKKPNLSNWYLLSLCRLTCGRPGECRLLRALPNRRVVYSFLHDTSYRDFKANTTCPGQKCVPEMQKSTYIQMAKNMKNHEPVNQMNHDLGSTSMGTCTYSTMVGYLNHEPPLFRTNWQCVHNICWVVSIMNHELPDSWTKLWSVNYHAMNCFFESSHEPWTKLRYRIYHAVLHEPWSTRFIN